MLDPFRIASAAALVALVACTDAGSLGDAYRTEDPDPQRSPAPGSCRGCPVLTGTWIPNLDPDRIESWSGVLQFEIENRVFEHHLEVTERDDGDWIDLIEPVTIPHPGHNGEYLWLSVIEESPTPRTAERCTVDIGDTNPQNRQVYCATRPLDLGLAITTGS